MPSDNWESGFSRVKEAANELASEHGFEVAIDDDHGTVRVANRTKGKGTEFTRDRVEDCGTGGEAAEEGLRFVKRQLERDLL